MKVSIFLDEKEDKLSRKRFPVESVIVKLHEAEVKLSRGSSTLKVVKIRRGHYSRSG